MLGTLVKIACVGLPAAEAHKIIEDGFAAVAKIHRLMSFHEEASDVTRLNREAVARPVEVDPQTFAVLSLALNVSEVSAGVFDISIADRMVSGGRLPRPCSAPSPDPAASWRDIELLEGNRVRFHRPLWIDLGGIAKGYAVDRAMAHVALDPEVHWVVNAGGDLRVAGRGAEPVLLRTEWSAVEADAAVVELENASLASSNGRAGATSKDRVFIGPHVDGRGGGTIGARRFVSVIAAECAVADALTKVVLASRSGAIRTLKRYGATAYLHDARGRWRTLGAK